MKRFSTATSLYLNVCLLFLLTSPAIAQSPCDDTQVTLDSQAEVDNFPSRYCSTLCSLMISGSDITNLDSLYILERVGQLTIQFNPMLVDIDGLSNITTLKGTCPSRGLVVEGNNLLANLDGLSSLTSISGHIAIASNTMLQNIDGLSNLDSIGSVGSPSYGNDLSIEIRSNASLDDIDGLSGLTAVNGLVNVAGNPALMNLNGLGSITQIGAGLYDNAALIIRMNDALTNLDALSALTSVQGFVIIENNNDLISLTGLSNLNSIGQWTTSSMSLVISYNDDLPNLNGLQGLDTIPGTMAIVSNAALVNVDGLSSLRAVWREGSLNTGITIESNASLRNISGLSGLELIGAGRGSYLDIESNPVLESISLSSLRSVQGNLGGSIRINNNALLTDLDGFSSLESVRGGLSASINITNNARLQNIDGLSTLSKLATARPGQALVITDNATLGEFCGLYTLFNTRGIGCGSPECYSTEGVVIERNERNPTPEEIEAEGPCDTDSSQPTNLVFSKVTSEGMQVTFNRASTFASGYLVLMKAFGAPAPEDVPSDGTEYHVGEVLGSSTIVIHVNGDTTLTVTGLEPSTPYYFDVFSWKSTANGPDYLTVNPLEGNQTTSGQNTFVSSVTFTNVTSESMTVAFHDPQPGHYITLMKAYGYPSPNDVLVNGRNYNVGSTVGSSTIVVNKGDGSPFDVRWLVPNTPYYFDIYMYDPQTLVYELTPSRGSQSTEAEGSGARIALELLPYPNPVESNTSIPFRVVSPASSVQVVIYDMAGREVDILVSGSFGEGVHEATWDGSDRDGRRVQPGMYVYSVKSDEGVVTGRLAVR